MKIRFDALWLGASMALTTAILTPLMADEFDKETKLEFSGPVEVPGKVLAAGKYVFKIADSREDTPDKTIIQFEERPSGSPEAIHSWFYPGDNTGWQFVYPKGERSQMSSQTTLAAAAPAPPAATPTPAPEPTPAPAVDAAPAPSAEPVGSVTVTEDDVAIIAQN